MPAWLAIVILVLMLVVIGGFFVLMFSQMAAKRERTGRAPAARRPAPGVAKGRSTKTRKRKSR